MNACYAFRPMVNGAPFGPRYLCNSGDRAEAEKIAHTVCADYGADGCEIARLAEHLPEAVALRVGDVIPLDVEPMLEMVEYLDMPVPRP